MILLIDNYDSFVFNIYQYIEELGFQCTVVRNDKITLEEIKKMQPEGIVLSPGPGEPDEAGICLDIIREFQGLLPMFGVCLGHQVIGQSFGGKIIRANKLMHGKTSKIYHRGEGVFQGLDSPIEATRYHSLIISENEFPNCLNITARTTDGVIMGIKHRDYLIEGVQFHPESIMTPSGKKILHNFLKYTQGREALR